LGDASTAIQSKEMIMISAEHGYSVVHFNFTKDVTPSAANVQKLWQEHLDGAQNAIEVFPVIGWLLKKDGSVAPITLQGECAQTPDTMWAIRYQEHFHVPFDYHKIDLGEWSVEVFKAWNEWHTNVMARAAE
jgi:hypothetical protein